MPNPTLLIVADRGGLRAYQVKRNQTHTPDLHQIDSFMAQEAHGRFQDKVTDRAGAFQSSGSHGGHQTGGVAEHGTIDIENDRRACKHVASRINELYAKEQPKSWVLAVPATIAKLVLDHVDKDAVAHLSETVHADLLRLDMHKLASHFPSLQPA